jgi:hypothetical protein
MPLVLTFAAVSATARTAVVRLNACARLATLMGASSGLEMLLTLTHLWQHIVADRCDS